MAWVIVMQFHAASPINAFSFVNVSSGGLTTITDLELSAFCGWSMSRWQIMFLSYLFLYYIVLLVMFFSNVLFNCRSECNIRQFVPSQQLRPCRACFEALFVDIHTKAGIFPITLQFKNILTIKLRLLSSQRRDIVKSDVVSEKDVIQVVKRL